VLLAEKWVGKKADVKKDTPEAKSKKAKAKRGKRRK
jgi:hypothetical protein